MDQELKDDLRDTLEEATEVLDRLVELCRHDPYLEAYVPGNLWASRYGFTGEGVLDIVEKYLNEST